MRPASKIRSAGARMKSICNALDKKDQTWKIGSRPKQSSARLKNLKYKIPMEMAPQSKNDARSTLIGRVFCLNTAMVGIHATDGRRTATQVPGGAIVKVVAGTHDGKTNMVDIIWEGKLMAVFAQDVVERGEEITAR
jgi:hypothetical protein